MATQIKRQTSRQTLEKTNKKFDRLSRKRKRIAILKDVLKISVDKGLFAITQGTYGTLLGLDYDKTLQENLLNNTNISCHVCAKGAMFCSRVRLGNEFTTKQTIEGSDTIKALDGIFTSQEMNMLEDIFESEKVALRYVSKNIAKKLRARYENDLTSSYIKDNYPYNPRDRFIKVIKNILWADGNVLKGVFRYLK